MFRNSAIISLAFVGVLASSSYARAQAPDFATAEGDRSHRAIVGASFGMGGFHGESPSCSICPSWSGSGWDGNFVVGTFLGRRQAIVLEMSGLTPAEDYNSTFGAFTLQYLARIGTRAWARGGYGVGYLQRPANRLGDYSASRPGGVLSGTLGIELFRNRRWSVDAEAQVKKLRYLDKPATYASIGLGFHWYPKLPSW